MSEQVEFYEFCELLENLCFSSTTVTKKDLLKKMLNKVTSYHYDIAPDQSVTTSAFNFLRLLIPSIDRERPSYGLSTVKLSKLLQKLFELEKNDELNASGCDIGTVISQLVQHRLVKKGTLSILTVNNFLDKLTDQTQGKHIFDIEKHFLAITDKITALELKWLVKIILKDLKLKFSFKDIFDTIQPGAFQIYQQCSLLSEFCKRVFESQNHNHEISKVFVPLLPQLCERINIDEIDNMIKRYNFYVETKFDGERQQMHLDQNVYKYFSRQRFCYTSIFGRDPNSSFGFLTRFIHKAFKASVKSCILDGEMMVWSKVKNRFISKGEGFNFRNYQNKENEQVCFCVFDILYLNGATLINKPYYERIRVLKNVFDDIPGRIIKTVGIEVKSKNEFMEHFNKLISNNEEGMVAKQANSKYFPGKRGCGWYKFKPDYLDGTINDLDLVVLGVSLNKSVSSKINEIIVGLKDHDYFLALAVLTSHFSKNLHDDLYHFLSKVWTRTPTKMGPNKIIANINNINFGLLLPEYYIDPKKSIVVQVRAAELQESYIFPTKYTLRFPRLVTIKDKCANDVCTLDEFERLYDVESKQRIVKMTKQVKLIDDRKDNVLINTTSSAHLIDVCILNSNTNNRKLLEKKIILLHGRIVTTPNKTTTCCVAAYETEIVRQFTKKRTCTIFHENWLLCNLKDQEQNCVKKFHPSICFCISLKDEELLRLKSTYQKFPYENEVYLLIATKIKDCVRHDGNFKIVIRKEKDSLSYNNDIYDNIKGYFKEEYQDTEYLKAKLVFISRGGIITSLNKCDIFITKNFECNENKQQNVFYYHYSWILRQFNNNEAHIPPLSPSEMKEITCRINKIRTNIANLALNIPI